MRATGQSLATASQIWQYCFVVASPVIREPKANVSRYVRRTEAGERIAIRAPLEPGDPTEDWPEIRLPRGTAGELIDADRGEA